MNAASHPPFFAVRPGRPEDYAYIVERWYSSARQGHDGGPLYTVELKRHVNGLLQTNTTAIRVAADVDDDDAIHGWAVLANLDQVMPLIHYVYVREDSRRLGVARELLRGLEDRPCVYTHRPRACSAYRLDFPCTREAHCVAHVLPKPPAWMFSAFQGRAQ